ncbi:hypothetical protein [Microbulbifer magnicolonia]|uniref:hypothetical protein n=1 Tax=Microbulbifer magnicolonia TaxID=3109744 RepID=UPI002B408276|nr:hypothetical protein [Microbulbifer sp. GG15]
MIIKIWKDPVWSKVIATAIISFLAALVYKMGVSSESTVKLVSDLANFLTKNFEVKMWQVVLLLGSAVTLLVVIYRWFSKKFFYSSYRTEYLFDNDIMGLKWEWKYSADGELVDFKCLCPACSMQMYFKDKTVDSTPRCEYVCPKCSYSHGFTGFKNVEVLVKLLIERIIRLGRWKKRVA